MNKLSLELEISDKFIDYQMSNALTAITYWCGSAGCLEDELNGANYLSEVISRGGTLGLYVTEKGYTGLYKLDKEGFLRGLKLYCLESGTLPKDIEEHGDMYTSDMIVQCALFGEVVFS